MADVSILGLAANNFIGDTNAQLVAGDLPALPGVANNAGSHKFAHDNAMAIVSKRYIMPTQFLGGSLKAKIVFHTETDNTNDLELQVFVEAITPTDTINLNNTVSWGAANSGTVSVSGSTAGDPLTLVISLTNTDGIQPEDLVRFGIRRNIASADDDILGYVHVDAVEILETQT